MPLAFCVVSVTYVKILSEAVYVFCDLSDSKEHRVCVRFCLKLGKTASETHKILQTALGDILYQKHK
jgi:hypothetical protein